MARGATVLKLCVESWYPRELLDSLDVRATYKNKFYIFIYSFPFSGTDRYACCGEFICHGSHVGYSSNFGRDVVCNVNEIMKKKIPNENDTIACIKPHAKLL